MKLSTKILVTLSFLAFLFVELQAQKFGHVNTGNILIQIPATKTADVKLKAMQDSLVALGQTRAKALQEEYIAFAKAYEEGNVPPVEAQRKQAEFEKKDQELAQMEDEISAYIANKRKELLSPILDSLDKALKEVGKEGGYTMIFDTSVFNTILFARDSDDLEAKVKAKMGIQ